jgi:hypothetical protein
MILSSDNLISDTVMRKDIISWDKWYKNCLRTLELLDVNGRHLGFTFLIGRMTDYLFMSRNHEVN